MNLAKSMGRSMTLIGFVIMLMVALSACSKKDKVGQPGADLEIFEIALPNQTNPNLRDFSAADLGEGRYEVSRIGFRVESWPHNVAPSFQAELRHTLGVVGVIDPVQDTITFSNSTDGGAPLQEVEFAFELGDSIDLMKYSTQYYLYGYVAEIGIDSVSVYYHHNRPDLDRIMDIVREENRVARGAYKLGGSEAFVLKTDWGFSLFFVVYGDLTTAGNSRAVGRIDYLHIN